MSLAVAHARACPNGPDWKSLESEDLALSARLMLSQLQTIETGRDFTIAFYGTIPGLLWRRPRGGNVVLFPTRTWNPLLPGTELAGLLYHFVGKELAYRLRPGRSWPDTNLQLVQPKRHDHYKWGLDGAFLFKGAFATFDLTINPNVRNSYADVIICSRLIKDYGIAAVQKYAAEIADCLIERLV